jgi:hypothetical protein
VQDIPSINSPRKTGPQSQGEDLGARECLWNLFFFSATTLRQILARTGFEVLETSYPWKLVPWPLMLYQINPRIKTALGPLGRLPLALYVNLFDAMFVIARKR